MPQPVFGAEPVPARSRVPGLQARTAAPRRPKRCAAAGRVPVRLRVLPTVGAVLVALGAAGCAEEPSTAVVTAVPDGSISEDDTPTLDPADASAAQPTGTPTTAPSGTPTTGPADTPTSSTPASASPTTGPTGTPTSSTAGAPDSEPGGAPTTQPADSSESPSPGKEELASPELGTHLDDLASRLEAGVLSEEEVAAAAPVRRGGSVGVTVHVDGNVDGVVALLAGNGVVPRHVGEDFVEAFVPVRLLRQVGSADGVLFVEPIVPPEPALEPQGDFAESSQEE